MQKKYSVELLKDKPGLTRKLEELRNQISAVSCLELARRTASRYECEDGVNGLFHLQFWGRNIRISYPEFIAFDGERQLSLFEHVLLGYYFNLSDGTPVVGRWISFSELPDGSFYAAAFQGYTGDELVKEFGDDIEIFKKTAVSLGGQPENLGNAAYAYQALPNVALLVTCWLGDEDFPSSYRVLFDVAASNHLSTDGCAILGSTLTRMLIKKRRSVE